MIPSKRRPLRHVAESEMDVIEHVVELKQHAELIDELKQTADKLQRDYFGCWQGLKSNFTGVP